MSKTPPLPLILPDDLSNNPPDTAIVVVTYNAERYLVPCLMSLQQQSQIDFTILVIDNASTDHTVELIRLRFPSIFIHENKTNLGFSGACNQGISAALRAKISNVCFLNPDAQAHPDWLKELVAARHSDRRSGVIQSKIYQGPSPSSRLNSNGNKQHYLGFGYCGQNGCEETGESEEIREIPFASGGACLITRELIEQIGDFDDSYFMYHEDVDLCHRARLIGFRILYAPRAIAWHDYRFERGKQKYYLLERNRLRTFFKNYESRTILLLLPIFLLTESSVLCRSLLRGWFFLKLKSYGAVLRGLPMLLKDRRSTQALRLVPDWEIVRLFTPRIEQQELAGRGLNLLNRLWEGYWKRVKKWI